MQTSGQKQWSIKGLLEWTEDYFVKAKVDQPRLCAELLLAQVLGVERIDLYIKFDHCPEEGQRAEFRRLVRRCAAGEPVAYLTGKAHFYSMEFAVGPGCLIPRPETETLVAQAIDFCRHETNRPVVDVLDLCTGSGCAAIAIAANVLETEAVAVDSSPAALAYARRNVAAHELEGRITLLESDLFSQVEKAGKGVFDLIVANPPYISTDAFSRLNRTIRDYEPRDALWAGEEGLDVIRRIVAEAHRYLADEASLMIEIAYDQSEAVMALFQEAGYLSEITAVRDNLGHQRMVRAKREVV